MIKHMANKESKKTVETLTHEEARRKNIPTAEYQSVMQKEEQSPVRVAYGRGTAGLEKEKTGCNRDLDPQLLCAARMSRTGRTWWSRGARPNDQKVSRGLLYVYSYFSKWPQWFYTMEALE
jgi:hypothetical protein